MQCGDIAKGAKNETEKIVSVIGASLLMMSVMITAAGCRQSAGNDSEQPAVAVVHVESVSIDNAPTTVKNSGDEFTLTVTVLPANATNKAVTWESSDQTVATVDGDGKVTCLNGAGGTATITVKTVDANKTATYMLTVVGSI